MRFIVGILALLPLTVFAASGSPTSTTSSSPSPNPHVCGDLFNGRDSLDGDGLVFYASKAYECLTSVPFNPAVASRLIKYYNDTIQFQSTLAYLAHPPPTYQQPATDLLAGLAELQRGIDQGVFADEYEFEAALNRLVYSAHDGHLGMLGGVLEVFTFSAPVDIVSLSLEGKELPKVYIADDWILHQIADHPLSWQPSAISTINDQDVVEYLTEFAITNAFGNLEPHTDWNMLMRSAALDSQGYLELFAAASIYPGATITFTFENGTRNTMDWLSLYYTAEDTGPLETGGDFYNYFVLGFLPESYNETDTEDDTGISDEEAAATQPESASSSVVPLSTPTADLEPSKSPPLYSPPYPPSTDIYMADDDDENGMLLRGYFLNESSLAVLAIPSFSYYGEDARKFSDAVKRFIRRSRDIGLKKVIIDVQQNTGGETLLAIETFKLFFPSREPFAGSRRRAHPMADVMGSTITDYWNNNLTSGDDGYTWLSTNEWVVTGRIDAETSENFTSWQDYFGPVSSYHGDDFTKTEKYNLTSQIFDFEAIGLLVDGWESPRRPAFAAEDIIIFGDGICGSACALFMEMMHHEAGVRTVVAGGRPNYGPMQSPAGTRGALVYSSLDEDINLAIRMNQSLQGQLPNRTLDFFLSYISVNLRDQVREQDRERTPLQFLYEPADCRIFYTPQTWYNFTNLWNYAADAIWRNPALCVLNSTSSSGQQPPAPPPPLKHLDIVNLTEISAAADADNSPAISSSIDINDTSNDLLGIPGNRKSPAGKPCTSDSDCKSGRNFRCKEMQGCKDGEITTFSQCVQTCKVGLRQGGCECMGVRANINRRISAERLSNGGYCRPNLDSCTDKSYDYYSRAWKR